MKSTVYLVQLDCVWENKQANFDRVNALLDAESPAAGSLIVLPEMFATGFSPNTAVTKQGADRESDQFLRSMAQKHGCCVVGGVVTENRAGKCQNEAVVLEATGRELARYAKMQPFNLGGEGDVHVPGSEVFVCEWAGLKIAPLICYDLRFPELARTAVLRHGAEVLIYIASWPIKRYQHWLTLLQARAIENLAYVVGVNRCGADPQFSYAGRSIVVDPHGVIIADAGSQERVMGAQIEKDVVVSWRAEFPALADARK
jgi:omega-amidase